MKLRELFRRKPKREVTIAAVVTRKDGTVEDLGVISRGTIEMKPEAK